MRWNKWLSQSEALFALDLSGKKEVRPQLFRLVILLQQFIKEGIRETTTAEADDPSLASASDATLLHARIAAFEAGFRNRALKSSEEIDSRFLLALIGNTVDEFQNFAGGTSLRLGAPFLREVHQQAQGSTDVLISHSFNGGNFSAHLAFKFPAHIFQKVFASPLRSRSEDQGWRVQALDFFDQIFCKTVNVAKRELQLKVCHGVTDMVICDAMTHFTKASAPTLIFPFEHMDGEFFLEVNLVPC